MTGILDKGTKKALNLAFKDIVLTNAFKGAIVNGVRQTGFKTQAFEDSVIGAWNELLYEGKPEEYKKKNKKVNTQAKSNFIDVAFSALSVLDGESKIDFRVTDREKGTGAFKEEDKFYAVTFTQHKKDVVDKDKPEIAKTLRPTIESLQKIISEQMEVVLAKNNQITVVNRDGAQVSMKITGKKTALF